MFEAVPTTVRRSGAVYLACCPLGEHEGPTFDDALRALQRWVDDAFPDRPRIIQTDENGSDC